MKKVDFSMRENVVEASKRYYTDFLILGPWVRIPPGALIFQRLRHHTSTLPRAIPAKFPPLRERRVGKRKILFALLAQSPNFRHELGLLNSHLIFSIPGICPRINYPVLNKITRDIRMLKRHPAMMPPQERPQMITIEIR